MPNLKAPISSSPQLELPEDWSIHFEREHNGTTWQVCASLNHGHQLMCRLSIATESEEQGVAEQYLRTRAVEWLRERSSRAP